MSKFYWDQPKTSFPRPKAKILGIVLVELMYINCMWLKNN